MFHCVVVGFPADSPVSSVHSDSHVPVHVSMSSFLRGKLSESDVSPTDSRDVLTTDGGEAVSIANPCGPPEDDDAIHLQALAQALAAKALLTRDIKEERRKMKAAAKRDSDIAQDTLSWRR
jgi:hypothetical protein